MKPIPLCWRIVLVRPRNPLNIGAAARAMANFGLRELVVVKPYGPVWQETRSAVGAEEILKSARAGEKLEEAIGDANWGVGTTKESRRALHRHLVPLTDFARRLRRREARGREPRMRSDQATASSRRACAVEQ